MAALHEAIKRAAPKCSPVYLDGFRGNVSLFDQYGVNASPLRQAHFAAQFLVETGGGTLLRLAGARCRYQRSEAAGARERIGEDARHGQASS